MRATTILFIAFVLYGVGKWAHGKPVASVKSVTGAVFVALVIALMDQGETEEIATGFAWLFLIVVVLSSADPITGIAKVINKKG
ncbi:MAG: hypothetical protein ACREHG_09870 [Candidatus Saccharimonadales bacterium]